MRIVLTYIFLLTLFSVSAQNEVQKIVKEYSRGDGPTYLNNGLGSLVSETHYDSEGRTIKLLQFWNVDYVSKETITNYYRDSKPQTITTLSYPIPYEAQRSRRYLRDHKTIKPDTTVDQYTYEDTLLQKIENFKNGILTKRTEYTYNEDGYEIEEQTFYGALHYHERWVKTTRDQNNRPIKIENLSADSSVNHTETLTYNERGLVTMREYESRYQTTKTVTKFTHNSDGLVTKEVQKILSPDKNKNVITILNDYNAKGLLIKEEHFDSLGTVAWQRAYEYNSSGQKTKMEFGEFAYHYKYNRNGDLISDWFEDGRSEKVASKRFIYEKGLLQKTEHYNQKELTSYTKNYYSENGNLIRQEPMPTAGRETLDWVKYYDYDDKGQQILFIHKQEGNYYLDQTLIEIDYTSEYPSQKVHYYENSNDLYTYYTYDTKGRQVSVYNRGGKLNRITRLTDGEFGILDYSIDLTGRPSPKEQLIDRLDTLKIETRGDLKIITLNLDYIGSIDDAPSIASHTNYHNNLTREETFNAKGELIGLKEITEDGILLFSGDENEKKSLSIYNNYTRSKSQMFLYGRYGFTKGSTTYYNADGLKSLITYSGGLDSIEYIYENGQLSREIKKDIEGHYSLKCYDYDHNGLLKMERTYSENGTENYRTLFENDGKHIILEQHMEIHPNREILYEVTYLNP